jgi:hypothetical protein
VTPKPDHYPSRYDYHLLDLAANIFESTQEYPLNPRDLSIRSLFAADMDFVSDLNIHMARKQHEVDVLKKARGR